MRSTLSTAHAPPAERKRFWDRAVTQTYFPLDLTFKNSPAFSGELDVWSVGNLSISRNKSDALLYRRHKRHVVHEREESFLITIPELSEIQFAQAGQEVRCKPGTFLVERSHLPYEFSYAEANTLLVLKVPSAMLRARIGQPERLSSLRFDCSRGIGLLFTDMIRTSVQRLDELDPGSLDVIGRHLVDLLVLSIEADERVIAGGTTAVQTAHLHRVERFVRANLADIHLTPQIIADRCTISVRYLHRLFETLGTTVCEWIRTQRLLMCDEALRDPACRHSISEIAYRWGFSDQAQFSRHYRRHFGRTPSATRELARSAVPPARSVGSVPPPPR